jgi:hypothetical protein
MTTPRPVWSSRSERRLGFEASADIMGEARFLYAWFESFRHHRAKSVDRVIAVLVRSFATSGGAWSQSAFSKVSRPLPLVLKVMPGHAD